MSETRRHTPGPWTAHECAGTFYVFAADGQWMVADGETEEAWLTRIRGVGRGATEDEQRANAELIASAPDLTRLLAAEKQARQAAQVSRNEMHRRAQDAESALAKACFKAELAEATAGARWKQLCAEQDAKLAMLHERDAATRRAETAEGALRRLHDECSVLKSGQRLNMGPMMHPSEQAVLEARKLLGLDSTNQLTEGRG